MHLTLLPACISPTEGGPSAGRAKSSWCWRDCPEQRRVVSERGVVGYFSAVRIFPVVALQGAVWHRGVESMFSGTEPRVAGRGWLA